MTRDATDFPTRGQLPQTNAVVTAAERAIARSTNSAVRPGPAIPQTGAAVPSGVYFYRLTASSFDSVERMLILR